MQANRGQSPTIFAVIRTIDREERLLAAADGEAMSAASKRGQE